MALKMDDTTNTEPNESSRNHRNDSKNKKNIKKRKQTAPSEEEPKTNTTISKEENDPGTWSKSKKKRMRVMKAKQVKNQQKLDLSKKTVTATFPGTTTSPETTTATTTTNSNLQNEFRARLTGSRFRSLNEELYTKESKESFERFSEHPELFEQYHEGFRHQVASWPVNPVNVMVQWITHHFRQGSKEVVVADFGCGDAQLAKDLMQLNTKNKDNTKNNNKDQSYTVHSFDLVSQNELVTACDMAHVPLENKSVDAVVFCLALMGTNLADFIREAHRVLKDNGRVKIAEVRSRIEYSHSNNNNNKEQQQQQDSTLTGTLKEFLQVLSNLGFECSRTDRSNKMFLYLELKKNGKTPNKKLKFSAKPCIYKRR